MTNEKKQLLLQDLCSRLPYGVKISKANVIYPMTGINIALGYVELAVSERVLIEDARPYLRPMSSMTDEEFSEMKQAYLNCSQDMTYAIFGGIDWLNKHHFDYRGLIERGIALEAPEGMYNLKEK